MAKSAFAEYNQQDSTFLNLFISVRRSACFRRGFFRPSGTQNCTYSFKYWSDKYLTLLCSFDLLMMDGKKKLFETCTASYRNK